VNQELGMFMISVELLSFDNLTIHSSSRPVIFFSFFFFFFFNEKKILLFHGLFKATLHFKSKLYQQIYTFFYSLPLLFGFIDESQYLNIPLMEGIYDSFSWVFFSLKKKNQFYLIYKPKIKKVSSYNKS